MCGRYTLSTAPEDIAIQFALAGTVPPLAPRYNVTPSQLVTVVGLKPDGRTRGLALLKRGLVAYWAENPGKGPRPVTVRAASVVWKVGEHLREKRCLIPASGFFEWRTVGGKKRACPFPMRSGEPFAFAGLWDLWVG